VKNVVNSQSYVSEFKLDEYPVTEEDVLHTGPEAFNAALNTVNIGKFNLGFASMGICEHAFYEAINHAEGRVLYGRKVTDFPHVRQAFTDAYARLVAMRLFGRRAIDYMRSASADDRRYLLFNPITKMKVTTEGEKVVDLLWDVIAAKGFEKDMYFEMAARDIRALPKLEGTVHVNMLLILKFMPNYLFDSAELEEIPVREDAGDDEFLFHQGPARGLSKVKFADWRGAYGKWNEAPNVARFVENIEAFKTLLQEAPPNEEQRVDPDFMLALGELFTLIVYGQLICEQATIAEIDAATVDQIFDVMVRDFTGYAVGLHGRASSTPEQQAWVEANIRKPVVDEERFADVWEQARGLAGVYEMRG
jgi:acyl-CoA dehydrogenase